MPIDVALPPGMTITADNIDRLAPVTALERKANGVAWAPDGSSIALATSDWVHLLSIPSLEPLARLTNDDETIANSWFRSVSFHPEGDRIAAAGGYLQQWTLADHSPFKQYVSVGSLIPTVEYSPDGSLIALGFRGGVFIAPADYSSAHRSLRPGEDNYPVTALVFSPSGEQIASVSDDGTIRIWDVETGQQLAELGSVAGADVAYTPDGSSIVSAGSGPSITVWDTTSGDVLWEAPIPPNLFIHAVEIDPSGMVLVAGLSDGQVLFLGIEDGSTLHEIVLPASAAVLAFDPTGTYLAIVDREGAVRILAIVD